MADWTVDTVTERFAEAAETARRLPPVRVQGYFNLWPAFVRKEWEAFAADEYDYRPWPPSPQAIDRMLETMRWVQWLEVEQRHLVWMRGKQYEWCGSVSAWAAIATPRVGGGNRRFRSWLTNSMRNREGKNDGTDHCLSVQ